MSCWSVSAHMRHKAYAMAGCSTRRLAKELFRGTHKERVYKLSTFVMVICSKRKYECLQSQSVSTPVAEDCCYDALPPPRALCENFGLAPNKCKSLIQTDVGDLLSRGVLLTCLHTLPQKSCALKTPKFLLEVWCKDWLCEIILPLSIFSKQGHELQS